MKYKFIFILIASITYACGGNSESSSQNSEEENKRIEFTGNTQGTTFAVYCNDDIKITYEEIENILHEFDLALSGYIPNSTLTKLNESSVGAFEYNDEKGYFNRCYDLAQEIYDVTDGAFDPTVEPLLSVWGFNEDIEEIPDSVVVDSLRSLVGFTEGYHFTHTKLARVDSNGTNLSSIQKNTPNVKLNFNAIAQGLAVDIIAEKLESRGAENYFVEIGGEIRVSGKNTEGEYWRIGIDKPIENSSAEDREIQEIVQINGRSIATSGSYRKFYEKDGVKYSHTINPKTGRPVQHTLLSATVVADNCGMADALATAFMVMGADQSMEFMKNHPELNIEVYLIFTNDKGRMDTYYTKDFRDMLID